MSFSIRDAVVVLVVACTAGLLGCSTSLQWTPERITPARFSSSASSEPIVIPMALPAGGLPVVQVLDPGFPEDPGKRRLVIVDTGASGSILSPPYVRSRGLVATGSIGMKLEDAFGKVHENPRLTRVRSLPLDGATLHGFDALVEDFPLVQIDPRLIGLLGAPVFRDVLLTIDYPRQRILLQPGGELPPPDGKQILPMRVSEAGHLFVPLTVLGEEVWMLLDTGYTGEGLLLSRYRLIALPWASMPVEGAMMQGLMGSKASRVGRMDDDVQLGAYVLAKPIVGISFGDDFEFLGASVLRHFAVTIDQRNGRVKFDGPPLDRPIVAGPVCRWDFGISDEAGTVWARPGGAAEAAGLRDGDRVVSFNGIPLQRWTNAAADEVDRAGQPVTVRVIRDGKELSFTIPPTVVVP